MIRVSCNFSVNKDLRSVHRSKNRFGSNHVSPRTGPQSAHALTSIIRHRSWCGVERSGAQIDKYRSAV